MINEQAMMLQAGNDARQLEASYQAARQTGATAAFAAEIDAAYRAQPDNLLYAAWHYRLAGLSETMKPPSANHWKIAIGLSVLCGFVFWLLSGVDQLFGAAQLNDLPFLAVAGAPIAAGFVMTFLALTSRQHTKRLFVLIIGMIGLVAYGWQMPTLLHPQISANDYRTLLALHVSLLAWVAVGIYVLWGIAQANNRFAFLIKSLEVIITGGLFAMAGGVFTAIVIGMFAAIGFKDLPESVLRLFFAGGAGLIPVLAVNIVYRPEASPLAQSFTEGLSKLIAILMRLLLPLTLLVLLIYLAFIPFNFFEPFRNREVLIVYNGMLFAIMGLLIGATPVHASDLSAQQSVWLRRAMLAVAGLAAVVSLYAMAAILYRTWQGGFTPNRLTVIGWNSINMGLLLLLLFKQWTAKPENWLAHIHETVSIGINSYMLWGAIVIILLPWLFK
ncbi:hypothetical protein BH10CHL1_BH10CHL1_10540 [soil metagenome]